MFSLTNFKLNFILFVLCSYEGFILAAPASTNNITDDKVIQEFMKSETAERLRLQTELDRLADKFTALESSLQMQRDTDWMKSKSSISFTAVMSNNVNIYPKQTLIFDNVLHNVGGAYNPTFGHFTVPVDGVYFISITITVQHTKVVDLYLMKNTTEVYRIMAGDAKTNYYEIGSASLVLDLLKGDVMYVQGRRSPDHIQGDKMSSFSAVLLYFS